MDWYLWIYYATDGHPRDAVKRAAYVQQQYMGLSAHERERVNTGRELHLNESMRIAELGRKLGHDHDSDWMRAMHLQQRMQWCAGNPKPKVKRRGGRFYTGPMHWASQLYERTKP